MLNFDIAKCVHTSNKFATCDKCIKACPVDTIKINDHRLSFTPNECVECGGCLASCPTDAFSLDKFNPINYIFKFLENDESILSCNDKELPCLAAFSVEELLSLVLISNNQLILDIAPCRECAIASTNLSIIKDRANEVNFLLEALEQNKFLKVDEIDYKKDEEIKEISRRELLSKDGVKKALKIKKDFKSQVESSDEEEKRFEATTKDIAKIRQKEIPQRRSLLVMALKRAKVPSFFHKIKTEDISFTSLKNLDEETCTNCQMCYRICPTGALFSDNRGSFINFNPLSCVKCHSCHDVCEPNSLTLKKIFDLGRFFEPKIETLVRFDIRRCDECGNFFAYSGGEVMCPRCKIEEEEALSLWGIDKKDVSF